MSEIYKKLSEVDVNKWVEKKNGLSYLSWAHAWNKFNEMCHDVSYMVKHWNNLPFIYDESLGYMVETSVTVGSETHGMWLPVLDGSNKAMKNKPYTYTVIKWVNGKKTELEKTCEAATMFDINTAIMRCLTKNLAMFGLGIYLYAGEDLPMVRITPEDAIEKLNKCVDLAALQKTFMALTQELKANSDVIKTKDEMKIKLTPVIK